MLKQYLDFYDQKVNGRTCPFVAIKTLGAAAQETAPNSRKLKSLVNDLNTVFANISCEVINNDFAISMTVNIQNCKDCPDIKVCSSNFRAMIHNKLNEKII